MTWGKVNVEKLPVAKIREAYVGVHCYSCNKIVNGGSKSRNNQRTRDFGNEKCPCWNSQGNLQTVEQKEKGNREKI